jgi:hypothetical protein
VTLSAAAPTRLCTGQLHVRRVRVVLALLMVLAQLVTVGPAATRSGDPPSGDCAMHCADGRNGPDQPTRKQIRGW